MGQTTCELKKSPWRSAEGFSVFNFTEVLLTRFDTAKIV